MLPRHRAIAANRQQTQIKAQHNVSFWRRLCLSTPKLIRRVIYLASENSYANSYANYFTRQKITHGLVFGGPLRLGALGPGPPGPLVKTALGRPQPTRHCVRWGPSFPHRKGHSSGAAAPRLFSPLFWHCRPSQQLLSSCTNGRPIIFLQTSLRGVCGCLFRMSWWTLGVFSPMCVSFVVLVV